MTRSNLLKFISQRKIYTSEYYHFLINIMFKIYLDIKIIEWVWNDEGTDLILRSDNLSINTINTITTTKKVIHAFKSEAKGYNHYDLLTEVNMESLKNHLCRKN